MVETAAESVTVYLEKDFGGTGQRVERGRYDLDSSQIGEDTISSIRVPDGWSVTVYSDLGFTGTSATYTADVSDLGEFDNTISSIDVSGPVAQTKQLDDLRVVVSGTLILIGPSVR